MPSFLHEQAVRTILEQFPQAKTRGFMKAVHKVIPEERDLMRIIPDAFIVDRANQILVAYEIEAAHAVPASKIEAYIDLWWALDNWCWDLGLIIIDRFGKATARLAMAEVAMQHVVHEARRPT